MLKIRVSLLAVGLLWAAGAHAQPKSLFYLTREPGGVRDFIAHAGKVDILVPTWYQVDQNGLVSGGPDPAVLDVAKAHHVEVMPIIAATGPGQEPFHKLLGDHAAIDAMN